MNYIKENPIGLDVIIDYHQKKLYDSLSVKWGVTLDAYPRCYVNLKDGKKDIEHYLKKGEYQSLLFAETNKFFFTAENQLRRTGNKNYETEIDLYFILNLKDITNVNHRGDEEVLKDIINVMDVSPFLRINTIERHYINVFQNYDYVQNDAIQPYFVCRLNLNVIEFDINIKLCINN